MGAVYTDPLILEIMARTDKLEQGMRRAKASFTTEADQMKRASTALRQRIETDSGASSATLKKLAGSIGAYFSGRELAGIINSFTQFQNSLRVAGVASSDLGNVQDRLFASAQKYGVELGSLGKLFGSLTSASKEMGASQEQVFQLTDAVSAALKISGTSATEASGSLLQLGQALRGGTVQAEEYNSLIDGLYPLLEAAAQGSDRFGGSVATLTKQVKDGKVASSELFNAILDGSGQLEARASTATLTLTGAYTQLTNALTVYVGQAAQTSGVQSALTQGITAIANNLDTLIPAIALLGAAMGVKYVASAAAATVATVRADAALIGLTTRAEVAGYALGTLARAFAINAAVLAVTAAIGGFAAETAHTSMLIQQANTQYDEMRKRLDATAGVAQSAESGARGVGTGAAAAEPQVRSFAGAVGDLANQLYRQAKAARAARVEMLDKKLTESRSAEVELGQRTPAGRNGSASEFRRGDFLNNIGVIGRAATGSVRSVLSGGRTDREAQAAYGKQAAVSIDLARQLREAKAAPLTNFVAPSLGGAAPATSKSFGRRSGGGAGAGVGAGAGAGGQAADQKREAQQRIQQEIDAAQIAYLQELSSTTQNAAARAELDKKVIEATRLASDKEIANNEALDVGQRAKLTEINGQVAALRIQQVQDREAERLWQQTLSLTSQALRDQDELLSLQADQAGTARERRDIELRRLDIAYRLEKAAIAEELAQAQITGDTQSIAAARKRLVDLDEKRGLKKGAVEQNTESPGQRYRRETNKTGEQIGEDLERVAVSGLDSLNDGLTDAIMNGKSLGDMFHNLANQVIADLLRIAIQRAIIGPLANALFGPEGGDGGALSSVTKLFKGGRASGGYVGAGQLVRVNEGSSPGNVEGWQPMGSGRVIPLGQMKAASARGGQTIVSAPQFNLKGAVVTAELYADMQRISQESALAAGKASYKQAMSDGPGRLSKFQTLGS